jgi:hypothetical protein
MRKNPAWYFVIFLVLMMLSFAAENYLHKKHGRHTFFPDYIPKKGEAVKVKEVSKPKQSNWLF